MRALEVLMDALMDALTGMVAVVVGIWLLANIALVFRQLWSLAAIGGPFS